MERKKEILLEKINRKCGITFFPTDFVLFDELANIAPRANTSTRCILIDA